MTPEGELIVRVAWDGSRVAAIDLWSTRPRAAGRVLIDRSAAEAVAIVPRLFSICGRAQAVAAALACEAAAGRDDNPGTRAARTRLVRGEMMQEYLWRMLIDWPPLTGRAPLPQILAEARREIGEALAHDEGAAVFAATIDAGRRPIEMPDAMRAIVQTHVLGPGEPWTVLDDPAAGEGWLARRGSVAAEAVSRLFDESPALGASAVALLPAKSDAVARSVDAALETDPAFEQAPTWHGAPAETGALARMQGAPLIAHVRRIAGHSAVARLLARMVELFDMTRPGADSEAALCGAAAPAPGRGLGWVETARGLLVHAVELVAGRVKRYRIVAPTEWNFHPRGALVGGLAGVAARDADALTRLVRMVVHSLDPCVASRIEVVQI